MGKLSSLGCNCQAAKKMNGTKSSLVAVGMAVKFGCAGDLSSASLVASLLAPRGKLTPSTEDVRFHYSSTSWATDAPRLPLGSK